MSFFQNIDPQKIPGSISPDDSLSIFRERILQYILIGMSALGTLAFLATLGPSIQRHLWGLVVLYSLVYLGILAITSLRWIAYLIRAGSLLFILYVLGLSGLLESGLSGDGRIFLIVFAVMSAIFLGVRMGIFAGVLSMLTLGTVGMLMSRAIVPLPPVEIMANSGNGTDWMTGTVIFITLTAITTTSIFVLTRGLERTVETERALTTDLRNERNLLEAQVTERTEALERRAMEWEAASRLARDITTANELDELLNRSAEIIRSQFGFYHVGVFLMDEKNEYAVLKAATGNAGRVMVERGHRLMSGEIGVVGIVVSRGEAHITDDVEKDTFHFKNPLLPNTRAEMAIPLKIGETIIGALDVQSTIPGSFGQADIDILQVIADQLAVAIEKASLMEQLRQNLQEVKTSAENQIQKTWQDHLNETRQEQSYRFRRDGQAHDGSESIEARQAFESGEVVVGGSKTPPGGGRCETPVAIPIRLRRQVIGVLDVHFQEDALTQDRIKLLETTANRMALALENARLMETIQMRAEQEHMVSEISARVRSSADIDSILRTAALELGHSLGISEVTVQLRSGN